MNICKQQRREGKSRPGQTHRVKPATLNNHQDTSEEAASVSVYNLFHVMETKEKERKVTPEKTLESLILLFICYDKTTGYLNSNLAIFVFKSFV